jgi:hypothetical protein
MSAVPVECLWPSVWKGGDVDGLRDVAGSSVDSEEGAVMVLRILQKRRCHQGKAERAVRTF